MMDLENGRTTQDQQQQQQQQEDIGSFLPPPVMVDDNALMMMMPDEGAQQQQDTPTSSSNNQYVMDISHMENNAAEEPYKPPPRKMTSASDATSITAASSFLDEGISDCNNNKTLLLVDEASSGGHELVKPRLDSLDEQHPACSQNESWDAAAVDGEDLLDGDDDKSDKADSCCYRCFKRVLLFLVVFGFFSFFSVLIGAAIEKKKLDGKQGTTHLYQVPQVCGMDDPLSDNDANNTEAMTFDTVQEAHAANTQIAHCGDCGSCSTAHDMHIMTQTAESLTRDSTRCAFKIFLGRGAVEKCMEERVGFTPACEDCWLDNISCSFKSCKFTCIKYKLFRQDNNKGGALNDCLKCDERMCGPGFIECSGSNRRRMGILSDIGRDEDSEQCKVADVDWMALYN